MYCNSPECDSCNPEYECDVCGFNYRGWCRDCEDFEDGLPDASVVIGVCRYHTGYINQCLTFTKTHKGNCYD